MALNARMLTVVEALYAAALDAALWPAALQRLATLTDSQAASFWVLHGAATPRLPTFEYINFDAAFIAEYVNHFAPLDPTVQYLIAHPHEPIVHDGLVISERDKERHPYYDWHARSSDTRFRLVGRMHPAPSVQAGVALHRTRAAGRYEAGDIERFALLHCHLQQALAIGFRLGTLGTLQQCTTELLDRNPSAVLLLDEEQRVVYANARATALNHAADGISVATDGVTLQHRRDHDRLRLLAAKVLASAAAGDAAAGGTLRVSRPSGRRPYAIVVAPVAAGRHAALSAVRPVLCIVIADPDAPMPVAVDCLREALGLTQAEARLAALLAGGMSLRSAGARLGVTYGTARARLADIFRKTSTQRQSELVRLLLLTTSQMTIN
jgi:DNA-binding CsgD family transcriptional regulator